MKQIKVNLDDSTHAKITAAACRKKITLAEFARRAMSRRIDDDVDGEKLYLLNLIANDLERIAGQIDAKQISCRLALEQLIEIEKIVRELAE